MRLSDWQGPPHHRVQDGSPDGPQPALLPTAQTPSPPVSVTHLSAILLWPLQGLSPGVLNTSVN